MRFGAFQILSLNFSSGKGLRTWDFLASSRGWAEVSTPEPQHSALRSFIRTPKPKQIKSSQNRTICGCPRRALKARLADPPPWPEAPETRPGPGDA